MKKTKVISIILTVVIMLSSISMGAYASDAGKTYYFRAEDFQQVGLLQKTLDSPFKVNYKTVNASSYRYYNQLSVAEKEIYNGIVSAQAGMKTSNGNFSFVITDEKTFDSRMSLTRAFAAVIDDVPELYWLLAAPYNVSGQGTAKGDLLLTFEFVAEATPYSSFSQLKQEYTNTLTAAQKFPVSGSTRYEKVRSIAETLCDIAKYADIRGNETANDSKIYYPSSCLLNPHSTVCDGYSKAFKMICDANSIPSIVVCGYASDSFGGRGGHAWNYVLMDDNKWYAVDITWMDDDSSDIYDFKGCFLVGNNTIYYQNDTFGDLHDPVGDRFVGVYLKYPALSDTAYDPSKPITVLLGDVNLDGQIKILDAKYVLQYIAGTRKLDSNQFRAADTNKDGKITIIDAKKILRAIAGMEELAA